MQVVTPKLPYGLNTFKVYPPHREVHMLEDRFSIVGKSKVLR